MTTRLYPTTLHCTDCLDDDNILSPRNVDAECLICGAQLCAAHVGPHLQHAHCCSLTLEHYSASPPQPRIFTQ